VTDGDHMGERGVFHTFEQGSVTKGQGNPLQRLGVLFRHGEARGAAPPAGGGRGGG
jgi:hypothetical protein